MSAFDLLSSEIRRIASGLGLEAETVVQRKAIPAILRGENVLLIAPTGSGKTEACLLPIFEQLSHSSPRSTEEGVKVVYVTPLRALNRDMLRRMEQWADRLGLTVEVRHGDTPQRDRRMQSLHPPDILITTPETLQAILSGSRLRKSLRSLRWIVVDEIHDLAGDRRGAQLSVALERVSQLSDGKPVQRVGLSATVANPGEVGGFLCGNGRQFTVIDATSTPKTVEYSVEFTEPTPEDEKLAREIYATPQSVARMQRIADLVSGHESTLIFVNSRTNAETLASRFSLMGFKVGVHHGSLPRGERERVEEEFKQGKIRALICTSTMELGIDIGRVDLVVQYMSPRQVNSLVQRVGRSGHSLARRSEGVILSVTPEDALESVVASMEARQGNLEPVLIQECPLDVLAHQVAGLLLESPDARASIEGILSTVRRAYPFRNLIKGQLESVVSYMEKLGYVSLEDEGRSLVRRWKCFEYYIENLSMIPDERRYSVIDISTQQKVGILGEEFMIIHAKVGVHFIIKGRVWQIESIQGENVYVIPYEDPTAAVPGWDGELIPIPRNIAAGVGRERGWLVDMMHDQGKAQDSNPLLLEATKKRWNAERSARTVIVKEVARQDSTFPVPTDGRVVVEAFARYLIVHTSAGDRVNATLGELFEEILLREGIIRHWWNDGYRILIEMATEEFPVKEVASRLFQYGDGTEGFLKSVIRKHFPFGYEMKFVAERFGALKRGLMLSDGALKELAVKFRFTPVYDETLREALATKVDIQGAVSILKKCRSGESELATVESKDNPSPLAQYILSRYAETEDLDRPASGNSVDSMKASVMKEIVSLLCFECGNLREFVQLAELEESPKCQSCGSRLLAVMFYGARFVKSSLEKRRTRKKLSDQEAEALSRARRSADLVLSYGKKGAVALSVYGVGPQTAYRILSRMHDTEESFYKDLLQAKLKFIETKPYWV